MYPAITFDRREHRSFLSAAPTLTDTFETWASTHIRLVTFYDSGEFWGAESGAIAKRIRFIKNNADL
jgi:hypothetical protein